jgi:hypothetical protein
MEQSLLKKQEHLRKAAETEARKFSEDHRHRPHIDSKSAAMVSGKKPIQDRTEEIMQMRTDRIKEKRQKKAEAKDQLEQSFSFKPTLKESKAFQSPSSVIERNEKWNEIKLKANEERRAKKHEKEMDQVTFRPEITSRARKLRTNSASVELRLLRHGEVWKERLMSRRSERCSSFSPTINQHNFGTPRGVVYEHLYSLRKSTSPRKFLRTVKDEVESSEESFEEEVPLKSSDAMEALQHLRLVSHRS